MFAPIRAVATPLLDAVGVMPYAAIGAIHADPPGPMPVRERGGLLTALSDAAVDILVDAVTPPVGQLLPVVEIRALGGRMRRNPPSGRRCVIATPVQPEHRGAPRR